MFNSLFTTSLINYCIYVHILLEIQVNGIWQDGNIGLPHGNGSIVNELELVPSKTSRSD